MSFELLQIKWMCSGCILIWYLFVLSVRSLLLFAMKDWFAFILASIILLNSNYSCIAWISELGLKPGFTITFQYVCFKQCMF